MSSRWRYQTYLALFLTLLSIYLLVPSVMHFRQIREAAEKSGAELPWYMGFFPDKQINLGLDLQGGIYLELEVNLDQALVHRSAIIASEIERFLKGKEIAYQKVAVVPKTNKVEVILGNAEGLGALREHLRDLYGNTLRELDQPQVLTFNLKAEGEAPANDKFQEILQWAKTHPEILDVDRIQNLVQVVLKNTAASGEIEKAVLAQFGNDLEKSQPPAAIYLGLSDSYQSHLKDETLKQSVETIRNRIDRRGVAEPEIRRLGDNRVVVELPGVGDPDRAIALVKQAGKLEFKIVDETMKDAQVAQLVEQTRSENKLPSGYTEEIVNQINELLKGKIPSDSEIAYEIRYDSVTKKIAGGTPYLLKSKVDVSGEMLRNAQVSVHNNEPYVSLSFDPTGAKAFGDLTSNNVGKRLAILLDGVVTKVPVIKVPILNGEGQITLGYGNYQELLREAEDLTVVLREGALPASMKEATKTVIGPSLGKSSIDRGFHATLLAAAVVMIFMALYYRWSGILADIAVILNILYIFSALTLFDATLTLPGIAAIVLTIGMAVDANVVILERVKEELRAGRTPKAAIDVGYANAIRAVVDAHVTTFLSGAVLYQFGTGPVRGFAVTLMIGIATTLYTAVTLTRLVYDYLLNRRQVTKLSL